jgi:hypothetical protein
MRYFLLSLFSFFVQILAAQHIASPDGFLGYKLGSQYTRHDQVVNYFRSVAAGSSRMQLNSYGKTNEGRELLYAIVSSEENMKRIETIRKNYLMLSGMEGIKEDSYTTLPVVVWLSYNVHGNEASSTEVSMKVLYDLISRNDDQMKQWLKNTVIIIDPCLNPDGRDRYVNWYNQVKGVQPNTKPAAREHDEPWPGGRVNHYYFDLNRDWAWQTQVESKARSAIYHQWMPAIHCDFHEQGVDAPYYFAPAAEPFHEVITPWQRNFQTAIGKNHAAYFDQKGWLYFTKEIFDLFYPSYGDTYPTYNGSVGMTYEQAGHSSSGLAVDVDDEVLTLTDRIEHHYTTSLSTIEVASANANQINREYQIYFTELLKNGSGEYKSYIIDGADGQKSASLKSLLDQNKIIYQGVKPGKKLKGYHYFSGKEEGYVTKQNDLLISTCQPLGALARVLLEPQSRLSDSVTYDITAWSLPYVYGIDAWAIKDKLETIEVIVSTKDNKIDTAAYANLIEYNSFQSGAFLSHLLKQGLHVKVSEKDFTYNNHFFKKGTLIVLRHKNAEKMKELFQSADQFGVGVFSVNTGFMDAGVDFGSDKVKHLHAPHVAVLSGEEASANALGEIWHLFDKELAYPITLINASSINAESLKDVDVLIAADGGFKILSDKESAIKNWVKEGGRLIALESAVSQLASGDWNIKLKKDNEEADQDCTAEDLKRFEDRERTAVSTNTPGAIYQIKLDDSHPLAFGYPNFYFLLKMNSNVLAFNKDVWNVGTIGNQGHISGFVGAEVKHKIQDGTLIAAQDFGKGSIICFTDNIIFRDFWHNGKLLMVNAAFMKF